MREFREAVESHDTDAMERLLADDVQFTSPVAFKPYEGRHITAAILRAVLRVMGADFRYVRTFASEDGRDHALEFTTMVNGKALDGCDFLHLNEDGKIDDFMVMVRPLSAAQALAEAMGAEFERITEEAMDAAQADRARRG